MNATMMKNRHRWEEYARAQKDSGGHFGGQTGGQFGGQYWLKTGIYALSTDS